MMPLEDLLQRGEQLARDAEQEIDSLLRQRAEIDEQLKRVRAFVRLVEPDVQARKKKPKQEKSPVSDRMLARVAKACIVLAAEAESFTIDDAAKSLGIHESSVRGAFDALRDREFLRKLPGRGEDRRVHYAVLDEHVLDMLTATTSENGNGPS